MFLEAFKKHHFQKTLSIYQQKFMNELRAVKDLDCRSEHFGFMDKDETTLWWHKHLLCHAYSFIS